MPRTLATLGLAALVLISIAGLSGCPARPVPFNTSGFYAGTYTLSGGDDPCAIEIDLYQRPEIPFLEFVVVGVARLEWECILPPLARQLLNIESESLEVPILALLNEDGTLEMDLNLELDDYPEALLEDAGLTQDDLEDLTAFRSIALVLAGPGEDTDGDGFMDALAGELALSLSYEDGDGEVENVAINADFAVEVIVE